MKKLKKARELVASRIKEATSHSIRHVGILLEDLDLDTYGMYCLKAGLSNYRLEIVSSSAKCDIEILKLSW